MRPTGFQLNTENSTLETSTAYTYSPTTGRLETISGGGSNLPSRFDYSYVLNSNLIATVTGPAHTVTNTWEPDRNVLSLKENKVGAADISSYDYSVNAIGQRTNVSQTGTAFGSTRDITWGYDSLGQVTSADSTIPGLDRSYQFDLIGNRLKSADSLTLPSANNYTPNALNQYTAIDGLTPSYDVDGNATSYPLPADLGNNSTLVWDGENRLISTTVDGVTTTYRYDAQSRRIAIWSAGLQPASSPPSTTIVYDGWNPVAEYNSSYTLAKTYTWGMDLSGTMQGAGGVGGLLAVAIHDQQSSIFYPLFDGNGNVSEYLDSAGAVQAHYEYDPFGRITVATGAKSADFSHRFSTKPLDSETGLYYYGYRYYDPATGRWPSRDPIEEDGGVNLYAFVGNDGVNETDYFGLSGVSIGVGAVEHNFEIRKRANELENKPWTEDSSKTTWTRPSYKDGGKDWKSTNNVTCDKNNEEEKLKVGARYEPEEDKESSTVTKKKKFALALLFEPSIYVAIKKTDVFNLRAREVKLYEVCKCKDGNWFWEELEEIEKGYAARVGTITRKFPDS